MSVGSNAGFNFSNGRVVVRFPSSTLVQSVHFCGPPNSDDRVRLCATMIQKLSQSLLLFSIGGRRPIPAMTSLSHLLNATVARFYRKFTQIFSRRVDSPKSVT